MSKITGGNPWTIPPQRPWRTGLVLAVPLLLLGADLLATNGPADSTRRVVGEPATPTRHWVVRDPPASAIGPETKARNDRLTPPSGFEAIPAKKVETLKVTPAGKLEHGTRP